MIYYVENKIWTSEMLNNGVKYLFNSGNVLSVYFCVMLLTESKKVENISNFPLGFLLYDTFNSTFAFVINSFIIKRLWN